MTALDLCKGLKNLKLNAHNQIYRSRRCFKIEEEDQTLFWNFFDLIGMCPTLFPPLAFIWAPVSGLLLASMSKGRLVKMAGIFDFAEELLPVVNLIPTYTLAWFYTQVIQGEE